MTENNFLPLIESQFSFYDMREVVQILLSCYSSPNHMKYINYIRLIMCNEFDLKTIDKEI